MKRKFSKLPKVLRAKRAEQKRAERIELLVAATKGNAPLGLSQKYSIILADPPWRYEHPTFSLSRDIEQHYPTLTLDEICALPVADLAADNSMLFLWVPPAILEQEFAVIHAWSFDYRTNITWVKPSVGMGNYVRQRHEHLLIGRRGEIPMPLPADRPASVIEAPRREHSRKPDETYEIIEQMYPELPKIELFARNARKGWAAWGNEVGTAA